MNFLPLSTRNDARRVPKVEDSSGPDVEAGKVVPEGEFDVRARSRC